MGKLTEKSQLEDLGVGGRIILKWIKNKLCLEGMDWMFLAQITEEWRPVLK